MTSCDYLTDHFVEKEIKKFREQGGFIETEKDRKLKEKLLEGIEPVRLDSFSRELESAIKNYATKKYSDSIDFDYVVYYNTTIEYGEDTIGYLDTNHYAVNLEAYKANDTLNTYLQFSKDFKLIFDFEH